MARGVQTGYSDPPIPKGLQGELFHVLIPETSQSFFERFCEVIGIHVVQLLALTPALYELPKPARQADNFVFSTRARPAKNAPSRAILPLRHPVTCTSLGVDPNC